MWVLIAAAIGTVVILYLARRLSDFFNIILTALFLSDTPNGVGRARDSLLGFR